MVLGDTLGVHALAYMDDLVIATQTEEEHFQVLEEVLAKLEVANMRLKLRKCRFFQKEIQFLGQKVSAEGIEVLPAHTQTVTQPRQTRTWFGHSWD